MTQNIFSKCEECGADAGGAKLCADCNKKFKAKFAREYQFKRRKERVAKGVCIQCGGSKEMPEDLLEYVKTIEPRMVESLKVELVQNSTACYKCYIARKLPLFLKSLAKQAADPYTKEQKREMRKAKTKETGRLRRERKIAENPNICHHCLKRDKAEGKQWCDVCLEKCNIRNNTTIKTRKQVGLCVACGENSNGDQLCDACKVLQRTYSKKWWKKIRIERAEQGICLRCGKVPSEPGKKACNECAKRASDATREQRHLRAAERKLQQAKSDEKKAATKAKRDAKKAKPVVPEAIVTKVIEPEAPMKFVSLNDDDDVF